MTPEPVRVSLPSVAPIPVVVDSPHSGLEMPPEFGTTAPMAALKTTWDAFVDELWGDAVAFGATVVTATFPRAFVDANRREDDIDETLLAEPWPVALTPTDYTQRGMGLIRRNALPDVPMYARKLSVAEVQARIAQYYRPYRRALADAIRDVRATCGVVVHLNGHSMKSRGNAMNIDAGALRPDVVVSDRHGTTADPALTAWAAAWFTERGLRTQINVPYQGGDLVRTFGAPAERRHSIQIEFNRALYMDEAQFTRGPRFDELRTLCRDFVVALGRHAEALT